ncbi:MAG: DapH/DapD/GlmU-related protein [Paeniclostridium sordellii]|nr:DapH/DapD/GlmU-related protein [Paeniclostridium sordellii]
MKKVVIGKEVWIAANTTVLPGVLIKDNVTVGAGAVLTKSIEEKDCIIGEFPAKVLNSL